MDKFLERVNSRIEDKGSRLTQKLLRQLAEKKVPNLLRPWLPVLQEVHPCQLKPHRLRKGSPDSHRCVKSKGPFDEENCALRLRSSRPFLTCLSKPIQVSEPASTTTLVYIFAKMFMGAMKALTKSLDTDNPDYIRGLIEGWRVLFDELFITRQNTPILELLATSQERRGFSLGSWITDALLADNHSTWRLAGFLGDAEHGWSLSAISSNGIRASVKVVKSSEQDWLPPPYEVVIAKRFAEAGIGLAPLTKFKGMTERELSWTDYVDLMRGPMLEKSGNV